MKRYFLPIFVIAALLRVIAIGQASLWYDENFSLLVARLPFDQMIMATAGDTHPPLWYAICWPLAHIPGLADWAVVRLPALVFSMLAFWMFANLLQALQLSERVQLAALVFFAATSSIVHYSQEGRMYSLLMLLVLWAAWAAWERRWAQFTIAAVLMTYTHNYALLYLPCIAAAAMLHDRTQWRQVLKAGIVTLACYAPWAYVLAGMQMSSIYGHYWIVEHRPGDLLYDLFGLIFFGIGKSGLVIPGMFAAFLWLLTALWLNIRNRDRNLVPLLVMAFVPYLLAYAVTLLWQPIIFFRGFLAIYPFTLILLVLPIDRLNLRQAILAGIFILPFMASMLVSDYVWKPAVNSNSRIDHTADLIREHWQPGDVILNFGDGSWVNLAPLLPGYRSVHIPDCGTTFGGLTPLAREMLGAQETIPATDGRWWIMFGEGPNTPPCRAGQFRSMIHNSSRSRLVYHLDLSSYEYSQLWLVEFDQ